MIVGFEMNDLCYAEERAKKREKKEKISSKIFKTESMISIGITKLCCSEE
jgi:hypothetical protein